MLDEQTQIPNTIELPKLTTAAPIAAATETSTARIYQLAREGRIPHVKIGRQVRFDPRRIAEWIANGGTV